MKSQQKGVDGWMGGWVDEMLFFCRSLTESWRRALWSRVPSRVFVRMAANTLDGQEKPL